MKLFIGVMIFLWLLCGVIGAWRMEGGDDMHFKTIAMGPISLAQAFNDNPVTYPGPD